MAIPRIQSYAMPGRDALPVNKVNWCPAPARAVLLIHDMQAYFLRFYGDNSPLLAELLQRVRALRDWAHTAGVPVVYTAQPGKQSAEDRALLNDMWGPGLTNADPALQAIAPQVAPDEGDTVLVKWRYSAFQRSPLETMMAEWGRDQLIICGVYAHIGCLTTALDAFMRDIQPFVVADALADFSPEEHRMALEMVAGCCGVVLDTAGVIALSGAGQPAVLDMVWLRQQVLPALEDADEGVADDDNLVDYGLDSVQVMTLLGRWQRLGLDLQFEELAEVPSLSAWLALIQQRRAA